MLSKAAPHDGTVCSFPAESLVQRILGWTFGLGSGSKGNSGAGVMWTLDINFGFGVPLQTLDL